MAVKIKTVDRTRRFYWISIEGAGCSLLPLPMTRAQRREPNCLRRVGPLRARLGSASRFPRQAPALLGKRPESEPVPSPPEVRE